MSTSFTITDAAEILALQPLLKREADKDAANVAHFQAEAARRRGVGFSGSAPLAHPVVRSEAERLVAARKAYSVSKTWGASARGRFVGAISAIQKNLPTHAYEAEGARNAYSRGFADENRPVSTHEIGVALEFLAAIPGPDASEARLALAELLMMPVERAA